MKKINIIYLLPELKGASGGAKVIYKHSSILNTLDKNVSSHIVHLKKKISYKMKSSLSKRFMFFKEKNSGWHGKKMKLSKNFSPNIKWMNNKIIFGKSLDFDFKNDFLIIPEIWAHFADDLELKKKNINYGIFVQGFYHMQSTDNFNKLTNSYKNSKLILSDSEYSIKCLKEMFPKFSNKIIRVHFSIDEKKFKIKKKLNLITYMPRKLPNHSSLLFFYLKNLLPKKWKIIPLINVSEKYLIKSLAKSKIFLSFSNLEGIGIPPIEAALSGNKVIGYTGGGGVEYWKGLIFNKVENGEIADFGKKVLNEIKNYDSFWIKRTKNERKKLAKQYSKELEKKSLISLTKKIVQILK
tara:strand:- start:132 stop:1190 length:1059 start_codon:yes stop_codon:yes gene_type:complete